MVNDVARVFFEAPVEREIEVELPEEDGGGPGCPMVGLLQKSLYGTRDAAVNFQKEIKKFMKDQGYSTGEVKRKYIFPRRSRSESHGSRG